MADMSETYLRAIKSVVPIRIMHVSVQKQDEMPEAIISKKTAVPYWNQSANAPNRAITPRAAMPQATADLVPPEDGDTGTMSCCGESGRAIPLR
jgi:hypothetical protein